MVSVKAMKEKESGNRGRRGERDARRTLNDYRSSTVTDQLACFDGEHRVLYVSFRALAESIGTFEGRYERRDLLFRHSHQ